MNDLEFLIKYLNMYRFAYFGLRLEHNEPFDKEENAIFNEVTKRMEKKLDIITDEGKVELMWDWYLRGYQNAISELEKKAKDIKVDFCGEYKSIYGEYPY